MRIDGIDLAEGSKITNLTVVTGTAYPSNPNIGELFFRTDAPNIGLYSHDGTTWNKVVTGSAGSTSPGGSDTQIQFNDGGSFGGDADLVWNKTTNILTINGKAVVQEPTAATQVSTKNYADNAAMAMAIVFG